MDPTSFCSECPCVDGSGKRGFHMAYVAAPVPWDKDRPFACAFCHHTSLPVAEAQAFKEPPRPTGIPKTWTYDVSMKAWVSPAPPEPKATVQWGAEHGARFLMVDHGDRIVRFNRSKSGMGAESRLPGHPRHGRPRLSPRADGRRRAGRVHGLAPGQQAHLDPFAIWRVWRK